MTELFEESNTESARRLVTVQKVVSLRPIEGKDRIELAQVMGWWCIVRVGEFAVGDLCAFHEPDTIVEVARPYYAFFEPKAKVGKYRIQTMRMGGVLSQGLALPLTLIRQEHPDAVFTEDTDVTNLLGCTKYEPAVTFAGHIKMCSGARRNWPANAPAKTDEVRIQSCMRAIQEYEDHLTYAAIKMDGSSMTLSNIEGRIQLCSRNFEIIMDEDVDGTFTLAVQRLGLADKLPYGYCVQGELVGPGINKNRLNLKDVDFYVFNVFTYIDTEGNRFENGKPRLLSLEGMRKFCVETGFKFVPVVTDNFVFDKTDPVGALFEQMRTMVYDGGFPIEGFVIRPHVPVRSMYVSPWLSLKCINPEYEIRVK